LRTEFSQYPRVNTERFKLSFANRLIFNYNLFIFKLYVFLIFTCNIRYGFLSFDLIKRLLNWERFGLTVTQPTSYPGYFLLYSVHGHLTLGTRMWRNYLKLIHAFVRNVEVLLVFFRVIASGSLSIRSNFVFQSSVKLKINLGESKRFYCFLSLSSHCLRPMFSRLTALTLVQDSLPAELKSELFWAAA
jgi:hypothetical protein